MKFIHVFTPLIACIYMTINYHLKKNIVELIHANYKFFFLSRQLNFYLSFDY